MDIFLFLIIIILINPHSRSVRQMACHLPVLRNLIFRMINGIDNLKISNVIMKDESKGQYNSELRDGFGSGRKLRISITDRCNMHCLYCMPYNNTEWFEQDDILSYDEILRLATIFAGLGIKKIRLTGGEPTIWPKIEDLIGALSKIKGIESISMTTNGLLLSRIRLSK